jgi:hypothetical protein
MGTLKQMIKELLGYRLIPQHHVILIECDGQPVRLAGPGYVRRNPLQEQFGPMARIGFQAVPLTVQGVRSSDGISFGVQLRVLCYFNPYHCHPQIAFELVRNGQETLNRLVQDKTGQAVRHAVGNFTALDLRSGRLLAQLEGEVSRRLRRLLLPFGITLSQADSVAIIHLAPPTRIEHAFDLVTEQKVMADALAAIPLSVADRLAAAEIMEKLTTNGGSVQLFTSLADLLKLPAHLPWSDAAPVANGQTNSKGIPAGSKVDQPVAG